MHTRMVFAIAACFGSGAFAAENDTKPDPLVDEYRPSRAPTPVGMALSHWKVCREFSLDGANHARVDDHPELRISALTLTAWVNTSNTSLMQPILAKAEAKGNWNSYMLRIQDGGRVSLAVENAAAGRTAHWRTKGTLTVKKWHHIAATWENICGDATDAKIYIDGIEQETEMNLITGYSKSFRIGYTDGPLYIGRDEMPSGHFVGTLRDVDVVGKAITGGEIKTLAAKGVK